MSHLDAVISARIGNEQSLGVYSIRTVRPSLSRSITRDRLGRIMRYPALPPTEEISREADVPGMEAMRQERKFATPLSTPWFTAVDCAGRLDRLPAGLLPAVCVLSSLDDYGASFKTADTSPLRPRCERSKFRAGLPESRFSCLNSTHTGKGLRALWK